VEERQEAAINGRRSQNSERVRAHLYEREFRPKPVRRADGDLSVTHTRVEPRGALDGVMETARLRRTKVTYIWDVSDPLFQRLEPRQEGGRGGRSRPRCLLHRFRQPRRLRHGRHKAPPAAPQRNRSVARTSTSRSCSQRYSRHRAFDGELRAEKGEHSSRVCVPPCFSPVERRNPATRE
jgi:hypothetical protein